jgi:hypothetical protein
VNKPWTGNVGIEIKVGCGGNLVAFGTALAVVFERNNERKDTGKGDVRRLDETTTRTDHDSLSSPVNLPNEKEQTDSQKENSVGGWSDHHCGDQKVFYVLVQKVTNVFFFLVNLVPAKIDTIDHFG